MGQCAKCHSQWNVRHDKCTNPSCIGGTQKYLTQVKPAPDPVRYPMVKLPPMLPPVIPPSSLAALEETRKRAAAERAERLAREQAALKRAMLTIRTAGAFAAAGERHRKLREEAERQRREEEERQKAKDVAFLRQLDMIVKSMKDVAPGWDVDVPSLTDTEVLDYATTGRWKTLAPKVTLKWKSSASSDAKSAAKDTVKELKKAHEAIKGSEAPPSVPKSEVSTPGWAASLLAWADPGIRIPDPQMFEELAVQIFGQEIVNAVASTIPFAATIFGGIKAIKAAVDAASLQMGKSGAESSAAKLRAGTPEAACAAVIDSLAYYRNVKLGDAARHTATAIAGAFPGATAISGPITSLAGLATSLHGLYRAYSELTMFNSLRLTDPYGALRQSGTVGGYVLLNYPAVGLMDPRRGEDADIAQTVRRVLFFFSTTDDERAKGYITDLRKAGKLSCDSALLEVAVS